MWSQIIFFAAVALLIILLLRKASFARQALLVTGRFSRTIGQVIALIFLSIASGVKKLLNRTGRSPKIPAPRLASDIKVPTPQEHKFWQEETFADKLDMGSHFQEGENLYKAGKYQEAEQFFLKAATTNPADPKIYARLGLLYLQTKNHSDAIEALKVAVKLDKHNPSRHYNLALAYWGNKDVQRAISSAREAITLDPVTPKYRQLLEQLLNS